MTAHIVSILLVVISSAIVSFISPDGEMKKYVKLVSTLAVLAAIVVPVVQSLVKLPEKIEFEVAPSGEEYSAKFDIIKASKEKIEQSVKAEVCNEFSLADSDVSVIVTLDDSDTAAIKIEHIRVTVPRSAGGARVEKFVLSLMKNTTKVTVEEV